jgi:hypothetical protein
VGNEYVWFLIGVNICLWAIVSRLTAAMESEFESDSLTCEFDETQSLQSSEQSATSPIVSPIPGSVAEVMSGTSTDTSEAPEVPAESSTAKPEEDGKVTESLVDAFTVAMTTSRTPTRVLSVMHITFGSLVTILGLLGYLSWGSEGNKYVWMLFVVNALLWSAVANLSLQINPNAPIDPITLEKKNS